MKLGNAVNVLAALPWLRGLPCLYWGDIDTHGLVILSRARAVFPNLNSILMDESTLLAHRELWGCEQSQHPKAKPGYLSADEHGVYQGLREHRWGQNLRLEQERIAWPEALKALSHAIDLSGSADMQMNDLEIE